RADARSLASDAMSLSYVSYLKLADPAAAAAFVAEHNPPRDAPPRTGPSPLPPSTPVLMESWQQTKQQSTQLAASQRRALLTGAWLLGLLAVASVAVLGGCRMADQTRRVGLL